MNRELERLAEQIRRSFEGEAWHGPSVTETLADVNRKTRDAVLRFAPARLDEPLSPGAPYAAYTQFIGLTQHDLYHAGQIALLKKAQGRP